MRKKVVITGGLFIFLLFTLQIIIAADDGLSITEGDSGDNEGTKISKAYTCLEDKINNKTCSSLSSKEKIFSLLAVQKCQSEVKSDSKDNECWPSSTKCSVKLTAQAILALNEAGVSTTKAQEWLETKKTTPDDINWILQIDNSKGELTSCSITYSKSGISYDINIGEDKKIDSDAGTCLTRYAGNYWLKINSDCKDTKFEISCNKDFSTNLLFTKGTSSTIHISGETNSGSGGGTTTEEINSFCFSDGGSCDYEASLWATFVLDSLGVETSEYIPYLITMADENQEFLPEAFLYYLTDSSEYQNNLLLKQKNKYWDKSGNKFYDTAVVFSLFDDHSIKELEDSKKWLLETQGSNGCWDSGNIINNAFLLYSIWPETKPGPGPDPEEDCKKSGYFCLSSIGCSDANGDELDDFYCSGAYTCCSKEKVIETCEDQGGEICQGDNEICSGGRDAEASNTDSYEICCVGGSCKIPQEPIESECEQNYGICRSSCDDTEIEETNYDCDDFSDVCCVDKPSPGPDEPTHWWIWVLIILIALTIVGIIFRDKLRYFWFRIKSGKGPKNPPNTSHRFPGRMMSRRPMPRQMRPPEHRRPGPPLNRPKPSEDFDDVLKKLKDMGS